MIQLALRPDGATTSPGTDARRVLQLVLAAVWLLDGLLQYQSFLYAMAFGQMIGGTAAGSPGVIARPISWNAALVEHHLVLLNTVFAKAFSQILAGGDTDPNSAPLLALLSLAYRPFATAGPRARRPQAGGPPAMAVGQPEEKPV